ncbi:MAG: hypothetical protein ACI4CS_09545 [Candidatus Weimeria sp.]
MDPYEKLAAAVVMQAVKDYRSALRSVRKSPSSRFARSQREALERFFRSEWYLLLTDIDGEMVIERIRKEVMG